MTKPSPYPPYAVTLVSTALLLSGALELGFAVLIWCFPTHPIVKCALHDSYNSTTAPAFWAMGIASIGIACIYAYFLTRSLATHKVLAPYRLLPAAPALVAALAYNIIILVNLAVFKQSFDDAILKDPTFVIPQWSISLPYAGVIAFMDAYSFIQQGLIVHTIVFCTTLFALYVSMRVA